MRIRRPRPGVGLPVSPGPGVVAGGQEGPGPGASLRVLMETAPPGPLDETTLSHKHSHIKAPGPQTSHVNVPGPRTREMGTGESCTAPLILELHMIR